MPQPRTARIATLTAFILLIAAIPLSALGASAPFLAAQPEGDFYVSPEFGYAVDWTGDWAARERDFDSDPDTGDSMVLSNNEGRIGIVGAEPTTTRAEALDAAVGMLVSDPASIDIISDDLDADVPIREFRDGPNHVLIEIHEVEGAIVAVSLFARETNWDTALTLAQEGVMLNGTPIFTGEPAAPTDPSAEPSATEEPATEEPVNETPDATEESNPDADTFASPNFDITVTIPSGFTVEYEQTNRDEDSVTLANGTSVIAVRAIASDDESLANCVAQIAAEVEDDPAFQDFRIASTSDGERFQGEDSRSAFALFFYTGADDELWNYYVRCSFIEEGESVLVITQDVPTADYLSERSARRQVENAIDLP